LCQSLINRFSVLFQRILHGHVAGANRGFDGSCCRCDTSGKRVFDLANRSGQGLGLQALNAGLLEGDKHIHCRNKA
jgi:hypothetical protein